VNKTIQRRVFNTEAHFLIIKKIAGEKWIFDESNKCIYFDLLDYFNGSENFVKKGYSLEKGILLIGGIGTGKTSIMEHFKKYCFYTNNQNTFRIEESRIINREFVKNGFVGLEKYSTNPEYTEHGNIIPAVFNLCIDDLALEREQEANYGNKIDVMSELIGDRYKLLKKGKFTHATSNLSVDSLREKYKDRISDRFKEMFNILILDGKSRRK
jgi:predicted ATPase